MNRVLYHTVQVAHRNRDYQLSYLVRPGPEEPIVFFHGLGSSKSDFVEAAHIAALGSHALLSFDFPGCGQSNYFDDTNLTLDDLAEIAERFAAALQLPPFTLIGHSMGGATALLFCLRYPARVTRFINVEGNLAPEDCFYSREVEQIPFLGHEEEYFEGFRQRQLLSGKAGFETFAHIFRQNVWSDRIWYDYCRSIVHHSDHSGLLEKFISLDVPRLFVYGSENRHLSYLPRLQQAGVPLAEIPASNHFPTYTNPEVYYRVLADFVHRTNGKEPD